MYFWSQAANTTLMATPKHKNIHTTFATATTPTITTAAVGGT